MWLTAFMLTVPVFAAVCQPKSSLFFDVVQSGTPE